MTHHSLFYIAALASSALPSLSIAAVHPISERTGDPNGSDSGNNNGDNGDIENAVILDTDGTEYDVCLAATSRSANLLSRRFKAARTFSERNKHNGEIFRYPTEEMVVLGDRLLIRKHLTGLPLPFDELDPEQLSAIGTAIGSLHRIDPEFLQGTQYPFFNAQSLLSGIRQWLDSLRQSSQIPQAIVTRWAQICSLDSLWNFEPTLIHGGFSSEDFLFNRNNISTVCNWESLQTSDPARDLAWVYSGNLSESQQDEVLSAYGRKMGSLMDSRIVPRARMWSQMELVTDMLTALREHDTKAIQATRTKVEDLAARLAPATKPDNEPDSPGHDEHQNADEEKDSTLTVGNLLDTSTATQIIDNSAPSELGDDKTIESRSYGN